MLNFLAGFAGAGKYKEPRSFRIYLELVNVAARGRQVKCLFVNLGKIPPRMRPSLTAATSSVVHFSTLCTNCFAVSEEDL